MFYAGIVSAADHLHPGQLAMFAPAKQVFETHALADAYRQTVAGRSKLIAAKGRENERYGSPNMEEPVVVHHGAWPGGRGRPVVYDGHHRLAEGMRSNAEIPLQHIDDTNWRTL